MFYPSLRKMLTPTGLDYASARTSLMSSFFRKAA